MGDGMSIADRVREHIEADDPVEHLKRYMADFTGARFELLDGGGDRPEVANQFTATDLVAVTMLGVKISGRGAIDLLERRHDEFTKLLGDLPLPDVDLRTVDDNALKPLWDIQKALDTVPSIGHVVRSKLLARKRPRLVPVRDQHVLLALTGRAYGAFTLAVRDAVREEDISIRIEKVRSDAGFPHLSLLRVLDIVVWMRTWGAGEPTEER